MPVGPEANFYTTIFTFNFMLSFSELKKGSSIIINNEPWEITKADFLFKGRGHSTLKVKLKNLITGNIISKTIHPSSSFEEPEISKFEAKFLYFHRGKYYFCEKENPSKRFDLTEEQVGKVSQFLKENQIVQGLVFNGKIINISLPIKIRLKVAESPPGVKGDRSQSGTKHITLETGAKMTVPLFIKENDIIEINTETGEYTRRSE